jgi:hypothetical protein
VVCVVIIYAARTMHASGGAGMAGVVELCRAGRGEKWASFVVAAVVW